MNYPQQSAQGLASLGRGNDSMLMHVTPREVAGLQSLAMAHGGSLTINPQTGLPEAGLFDAILPMAAGFALGPGGFGLFSGSNAALMAGLTVGGLTALASGDLGAGVMAGLGAGGGAGLGSTFAKMGQNAVGGIAPQAAQDAVISNAVQALPANVAQNAATNLGMFNSTGATAAMGGVGSTVPNAVQSLSGTIGPGVNSSVNAMGAAPTSTQIAQSSLSQPLSGFGASGKGFGEFIKDPFGEGFEAFKQAGGKDGVPLTSGEAAYELGSPIASIALSTMEPPVPQPYIDPDTGKYRGPQGQLNLSDRFDTGLRLAEGGTIATGGIRDLYGSSDNQNQAPLSTDGYGLGRLNQLGNQQSLSQAQTLGYAEGGYLNGAGDGMSDSIPATIEGKQPARLADGEFVVPADVVSHLGNGSSKAGSKRLYTMLDKVRHARTGNKKQGKEIKADKYLPA
jgi:hypothetical protein